MFKKRLMAGFFTASLVLSLGITPGVALDRSGSASDTEEQDSASLNPFYTNQQADVLEEWEPVDTQRAREALERAEQVLAEFPVGLRAHEKAATGEIWIQYPISESGGDTPDSFGGSLSIPDFGHAAIVECDEGRCGESTIEAYPFFASPIGQDGVRRYRDNWKKSNKGRIALLGLKSSSPTKRDGAAKFAAAQIGKPYLLSKKTDYRSFYCSKLVWAAWRSQGQDLDLIKDKWVLPMELVVSPGTVMQWARG